MPPTQIQDHFNPNSDTDGESGFPSGQHVGQARDGANTLHVHTSAGAMYVASQRKICLHYVTSAWFTLDVLSIVPSVAELILRSATTTEASSNEADDNFSTVGQSSSSATRTADVLMLMRLVRVARLIKLVRLSKFQRIYVRMMSRVSISHETAVKIKVIGSVILIAHWFACIFAMSASMQEDPRHTYWYRSNFCQNINLDAHTFIEQCNLEISQFYVACFTWAVLIVTGTGGTDNFPNEHSTSENIVIITVGLAAALIWTTVLALFCEMITNGNPEVIEFQQTLDELEVFSSNHDLPDLMRRRLREYFHQRKHVRIAERAFLVTRKLSTRLQVEVITLVYGAWLSKLTFLIGCEMPCVMAIAMRFQPVTYAPSESPPLRHLYVVMRGLATYGLQMITKGKYWGMELITHSLEEVFLARCLTYVDAFALARSDLWTVLEQFPESKWKVRKAGAYLALRVQMIMEVRRQREEQAGITAEPNTNGRKSNRESAASVGKRDLLSFGAITTRSGRVSRRSSIAGNTALEGALLSVRIEAIDSAMNQRFDALMSAIEESRTEAKRLSRSMRAHVREEVQRALSGGGSGGRSGGRSDGGNGVGGESGGRVGSKLSHDSDVTDKQVDVASEASREEGDRPSPTSSPSRPTRKKDRNISVSFVPEAIGRDNTGGAVPTEDVHARKCASAHSANKVNGRAHEADRRAASNASARSLQDFQETRREAARWLSAADATSDGQEVWGEDSLFDDGTRDV